MADLLKVSGLAHGPDATDEPHEHPQGQLLLVESGVLSVETSSGRWVMPGGCLGWVPPMQRHGASYFANTRGLNLYFEQAWSEEHMPGSVTLVRSTALLRALAMELSIAPSCEDPKWRPYVQVLADSFRRQPAETLFLPMPQEPRLLRMASQLLLAPDDSHDLEAWASRIGLSRRTLMRRFAQETGWSVGRWRQQMRLLLALERLAAGAPVTQVALELGYQSLSAFIALFKQQYGVTPAAWRGVGGFAIMGSFDPVPLNRTVQ